MDRGQRGSEHWRKRFRAAVKTVEPCSKGRGLGADRRPCRLERAVKKLLSRSAGHYDSFRWYTPGGAVNNRTPKPPPQFRNGLGVRSPSASPSVVADNMEEAKILAAPPESGTGPIDAAGTMLGAAVDVPTTVCCAEPVAASGRLLTDRDLRTRKGDSTHRYHCQTLKRQPTKGCHSVPL